MKKFILLFFCILWLADSEAQSNITTFILVRHAEKESDGTKDPDLNAEGKLRAQRLAALLKREKVAAVFSTNFKRTRNTVLPVAEAKGLQVRFYETLKTADLDSIMGEFNDGTILIGGHSNTIPVIANSLLGTDTFKTFDDNDYGNVLIISVVEIGKNARVTKLTY